MPTLRRRLLLALAALALLAGGPLLWWRFRPIPAPTTRDLFRGITYTREIRSAPHPAILHIITVNLAAPGLHFLVTPGDPAAPEPLPARTTSAFLREFGAQIAVNGDFFEPWWSNGPLDYFPHEGDRVHPMGFAASRGLAYHPGDRGQARRTLRFSRDERPSFTLPLDQASNAVSGEDLLHDGELRLGSRAPGHPEPRTAVALDRGERTLLLLVADGRQPHYSEGLTTTEVAEALRARGAWNAINLDGGGSSALVVESPRGGAEVLSSPIHTRIPGRERPVANHLGIFATR